MVPENPDFPDRLGYLWDWFNELTLGVASNGMGPVQVTWRDVAEWAGLTGNAVDPWEAKALVTLGVVRANILSEKMAAEHKIKSPAGAPGK